jgi:branched-chain amino acid transport system substrate-binding protein
MRLSSMRWTTVLAVTAALVLVATGCGDNNGGSATGDGDGEPIKVGASLPLTGEFSEPGKAAQQGFEVWRELVNEQGGLLGRPVELIIKDDASNQNTIVADYNALISRDRVDLLLGTFSSLLNLPASAVAERNRMVFIMPAGLSPELFTRGFRYLFLGQQATAEHQGDVWARYMASMPEGKRPKTAAYPTLDDPFAQPTSKGIEAILSEAGIQTIYRKTYTADTTNFDPIASQIKAAEPDLVVAGNQFEDGVGMMRALRKVGFAPDWLYQNSAPSFGAQYADAIGEENTEGVFYAVSHSQEATTPGNKEFVAKYKEMFGGSAVPEDAADAYASGQILQAAVEANETVERDDQLKLADWLRQNEVETILGPMSWNEDGSGKGEFMVGQWQDGKAEIILPEEVATTEKIVPGYKPGAPE